MADYWPAANGNWSTLSNWLTATGVTAGTLPGSADDVYADNRTITADINARVNSIRTTARTGGTAGGGFNPSNGVTLSAGFVLAGSTTCITFNLGAPNSFTFVGNVSGSAAGAAFGINNNSTGTVNVIGSIYAGIGSGSQGMNNSSTGTINVTGDVYGSFSTSSGKRGIVVPNGNCYVYGNVYAGWGGSTTANDGIVVTSGYLYVQGNLYGSNIGTNQLATAVLLNGGGRVDVVGNALSGTPVGINNTGGTIMNTSTTGTVNLTGNVYGGGLTNYYGAHNSSSGIMNIFGTAFAGTGGGTGAVNSSTGLMYITKVVGNAFGLGSAGIVAAAGLANSQNGRAYVEQVEFGPRGQTPITGPVYILPSNRNTLTGRLTALGNTVTFYNSLSVSGLMPPASSVRLGTVYNVGNTTGTMAVPSASAVEFGVPVDNTVGVAALTPQTVWGYSRLSATDVGSMGDRLRNAATAQSVGSQIASFNL